MVLTGALICTGLWQFYFARAWPCCDLKARPSSFPVASIGVRAKPLAALPRADYTAGR
jgi:hypothetical protein